MDKICTSLDLAESARTWVHDPQPVPKPLFLLSNLFILFPRLQVLISILYVFFGHGLRVFCPCRLLFSLFRYPLLLWLFWSSCQHTRLTFCFLPIYFSFLLLRRPSFLKLFLAIRLLIWQWYRLSWGLQFQQRCSLWAHRHFLGRWDRYRKGL